MLDARSPGVRSVGFFFAFSILSLFDYYIGGKAVGLLVRNTCTEVFWEIQLYPKLGPLVHIEEQFQITPLICGRKQASIRGKQLGKLQRLYDSTCR
ncbi:hypothetical protein L218DRAFT_960949 [Marasmius fiardii PR-910]|nr:hypothetical protein L218DRAFT_960949 [Marasmius fiardii PR-910]